MRRQRAKSTTMAVIQRLFRSAMGGALATLVDLGVLTGLVTFVGFTPRGANVPALIAGGVAAFVAQKYFAFRAVDGPIVRQAVQFTAVQIGSSILCGLFYDTVLRVAPSLNNVYVIVRLVTSNLVWLGFSFPLWHFVFRRPGAVPPS